MFRRIASVVTHNRLVEAVVRWFDTATEAKRTDDDEHRVDWVRCLPFFAMHFACFAVYWVGWSWTAVLTAVALYLVRMFAITGFYHRYFSHKTFRTSRGFQCVMALVGNSAVQRGPLWWAAQHRFHHAHSDKEDDLHSPHSHSFAWAHMFWITSPKNFRTNFKAVPDLAKYPELCFLDRYDFFIPVLLAVTLTLAGWGLSVWAPTLGVTAGQMFVWGFLISTIVLFHATSTINSLSHLFGKKRYDTGDESRNNWLLALITLGEGWHNNHHHYPAATAQGFFWYEIDITYMCLKVCSWLGLIWELQPVPASIKERALNPKS